MNPVLFFEILSSIVICACPIKNHLYCYVGKFDESKVDKHGTNAYHSTGFSDVIYLIHGVFQLMMKKQKDNFRDVVFIDTEIDSIVFADPSNSVSHTAHLPNLKLDCMEYQNNSCYFDCLFTCLLYLFKGSLNQSSRLEFYKSYPLIYDFLTRITSESTSFKDENPRIRNLIFNSDSTPFQEGLIENVHDLYKFLFEKNEDSNQTCTCLEIGFKAIGCCLCSCVNEHRTSLFKYMFWLIDQSCHTLQEAVEKEFLLSSINSFKLSNLRCHICDEILCNVLSIEVISAPIILLLTYGSVASCMFSEVETIEEHITLPSDDALNPFTYTLQAAIYLNWNHYTAVFKLDNKKLVAYNGIGMVTNELEIQLFPKILDGRPVELMLFVRDGNFFSFLKLNFVFLVVF